MKIKLVGPTGHSLSSQLERLAKYLEKNHANYAKDANSQTEFIKWADFVLRGALKNLSETAMVEVKK